MRFARSYVPVVFPVAFAFVLAAPSPAPGSDASGSTLAADLHSRYAAALAAHVDDDGMVDYPALHADSGELDAYLDRIAGLDADELARRPETARIAFWVNAYNALTLRAILDHYPIRAGFFASLLYPKNSIRQIAGVWDRLEWTVAGATVTLDEIEHEILRVRFREPRIHMALVCAAKGCPPLRAEPYEGARLDEQLEDQTERFLGNPKKFRIDRDASTVHLSPIFKWFAEDFVVDPAVGQSPTARRAERSVIEFIAARLDPDDAKWLREADYGVAYLDYDWSLNER